MRILHLSDVHLGTIKSPGADDETLSRRSTFFFTRSAEAIPDPGALTAILKRDLSREPPDVIVFSGDAGWSGTAADYGHALEFFVGLRASWPAVPLVMVPGNHDVDRDVARAGGNPQGAFITLLRELYGDSFVHLYPLYREDSISHARQQLVAFERLADDLLFVGVNSAASLGTSDHPVFIEPHVLRLVEQHIAEINVPANTLRIFVVHHHLFPFADAVWEDTVDVDQVYERADPSFIANSARLQGWLSDNHFHLVLHGHKHLSHGRNDSLWREGVESAGQKLLVVGAGSVGLAANQRRGGEPLTYNVLDIMRLGGQRWDVRVKTRNLNNVSGSYVGVDSYSYRSNVGTPPPHIPTIIQAERMDACHTAICAAAADRGFIRNFLSIVEDHQYFYPSTIRIGTKTPSADEVIRSFRALHPEWHPDLTWDSNRHVNDVIGNLPARFQFQHGPRLFGVLGRAGRHTRGTDAAPLEPLRYAVETLANSDTRAVVGLYNPEIDVALQREPLPGLMSVQFIPDGDYLDVVATFRKLELSFWWVVNMLELGELLRWAARHDSRRRRARRITFYASVAEWKIDPEAAFVAFIDAIDIATMVDIVARLAAGDAAARRELVTFLQDKIDLTNDVNMDQSGLQQLEQVVRGTMQSRTAPQTSTVPSLLTPQLHAALSAAASETASALTDASLRHRHLSRAKEHLSEAVSMLVGG